VPTTPEVEYGVLGEVTVVVANGSDDGFPSVSRLVGILW